MWCGLRIDIGVAGLRIIIQSATHDPAALDGCIEAYLLTVPTLLTEMSDSKFKEYVTALLDLKLEKDKTMRQEAMRFWQEIPNGSLDFERQEKVSK